MMNILNKEFDLNSVCHLYYKKIFYLLTERIILSPILGTGEYEGRNPWEDMDKSCRFSSAPKHGCLLVYIIQLYNSALASVHV